MDGLRRCRGVVKVGDGTDGVRIVGGVLSGLAAGPEGGGTGGGSDTMRNLLGGWVRQRTGPIIVTLVCDHRIVIPV